MAGLSKIESAIVFALAAHGGTTDKNGAPYILHSLRVMSKVDPHDEVGSIAAVLHDVVEDTDITLEKVGEVFGGDVKGVVDALTHRKGEAYFDYIKRVKADPLATKIKLYDLEDNSDPARLARLEKDEQTYLVLKYKTAKTMLVA